MSDPPSAPGIYVSTSTPFPWIEGGQGTLECTSQPGNPPTITYQWIRENVVIPGETGNSLVITSLTRNDNRKSYKYRPVIYIGTTPAYVHETKSFERPCTADSNPTPVITWTSNINPSYGALLRLVNIMRNQTGPFTCRAYAQSKGSHGLFTNQAVLTLIVQYPPSVNVILSPSSIKEGQDVSMTCLAKGVPDQYVYNGWTQIYRNQIIRSSNAFSTLLQNKRNLTLLGVSYKDMGTYRCSANNGIPDKDGNPNQTGEKDLDIKFAAVFNSPGTFYSELNKTVEIKIPFLANPPVVRANIFLTKNKIDQIITGIPVALRNRNVDINYYGKVIKVNGQEVVVTLHSFSSKLQGNYTIGVKNFQGGSLSTFVFEVIPSGPPESPKNFGVLSVTSSSITVKWLRGFNGGHQQTFVVLYQEKDSKENLLSQKITEEENRESYTIAIRNLMPQTEYDFWIYSYNIKGNDSTEFTNVCPIAVKTEGMYKYCTSVLKIKMTIPSVIYFN
ncbi:hypothetical protein KUTeg_006086 [Tegillarca granosa]|uniref:Uncharacterized protein n=1 Tax=Tegillarca granosa TaxID=220873 RepID=A0ABQ9FFF4_TEGGR|nr:hypothetical protein KUTeg_006086 [Tegillarca granosa]